MLLSTLDKTGPPWERWTDEQWHEYRTPLYLLKEMDDQTRTIMLYRSKYPSVPYEEFAESVNLSETAVRLRIARFYDELRLRSSEGHSKPKSTSNTTQS